jgi:hypothetical protein
MERSDALRRQGREANERLIREGLRIRVARRRVDDELRFSRSARSA